MTRRETMIAGAALGLAGCRGGSAAPPDAADASGPLDAALSRFAGTDPEFRGGLSNHGPMASEALEALGYPDRIEAFAAYYERRLRPFPDSTPLAWSQRSDAVGNPDAVAGLIRMFEARLAERDPAEVLAAVLPSLLDGVVGAAFHGVLRTGHAWRGWTRHPTAPRRTELAHGLGYWASRHQSLPGEPGARAERGLGPVEALARVPIVPVEQRLTTNLILGRFAVLDQIPAFADAVEAFDPDALDPGATIDALSVAAARLYLRASNARDRFVYLHGVTGSAAVRNLLPALEPAQQRRASAYLFQALAAVHATHGEADAREPAPPTTEFEVEVLADKGAASRDDHTIKLVEAALSRWADLKEPDLLRAAAAQLRLA